MTDAVSTTSETPLIVGIYGSPRPEGNTDILLDRVLGGAESAGVRAERIVLRKLKIHPCTESYHCHKDGQCNIRDDFAALEPVLMRADAVVVGTPIFFYTVPAQLKAFMDRCQVYWVRKYHLKQTTRPMRPGALVAVGATQGKQLFDGTLLSMKYFLDTLDVRLDHTQLVRGIDGKGEILDHPDHLEAARALGAQLAAAALNPKGE